MTPRPFTSEQLLRVAAKDPPRAKHLASLRLVDRTLLDGFVDWLIKRDHKSPNTAALYKSLVAKAMNEREIVNSQVRAAVRAYERYNQAK